MSLQIVLRIRNLWRRGMILQTDSLQKWQTYRITLQIVSVSIIWDFNFSFYFIDSGVAKRIIFCYLLLKSALCSFFKKKKKPTVLSTSRRAIFAFHVYIVHDLFCNMYFSTDSMYKIISTYFTLSIYNKWWRLSCSFSFVLFFYVFSLMKLPDEDFYFIRYINVYSEAPKTVLICYVTQKRQSGWLLRHCDGSLKFKITTQTLSLQGIGYHYRLTMALSPYLICVSNKILCLD